MANYQGFESYNRFLKEFKNLKQIYDFTYHLYIEETKRLNSIIPEAGKRVTINTSVGYTSHELISLQERAENVYPYKLRQLILISLITSLEVYLTDTISEAFKRDISFFNEEVPVEYQKNYILNTPSINRLRSSMILKDTRSITSGGLMIAKKFYKKRFKIDFDNLGTAFKDIEEIHIRRHLHVHRNGVCDLEYAKKYANYGFQSGEYIMIEHEYLILALISVKTFVENINRKIIEIFPINKRKNVHFYGKSSLKRDFKKLLLEFDVLENTYNAIEYFKNLKSGNLSFNDYIIQISIKDKHGLLILSGFANTIYSFFNSINSNNKIEVTNIVELKI